jgi:hypothetical protein
MDSMKGLRYVPSYYIAQHKHQAGTWTQPYRSSASARGACSGGLARWHQASYSSAQASVPRQRGPASTVAGPSVGHHVVSFPSDRGSHLDRRTGVRSTVYCYLPNCRVIVYSIYARARRPRRAVGVLRTCTVLRKLCKRRRCLLEGFMPGAHSEVCPSCGVTPKKKKKGRREKERYIGR